MAYQPITLGNPSLYRVARAGIDTLNAEAEAGYPVAFDRSRRKRTR